MLTCGIRQSRPVHMIAAFVGLCLIVCWVLFWHDLIQFMLKEGAIGFFSQGGEGQHYPDWLNPLFSWSISGLMIFLICFAITIKYCSNRIFDTVACILILAFSFYFCFKAGERGLFAFDQSIVFDGAYRILTGQIPYKDFVMPFGPMAFWTQAIFFKLLGINYFSYLFGAASLNVIAVASSILILKILFPTYKFLSYLAGLLTAVWFYAPFGTPWMEQTAFCFALLAMAAILLPISFRQPHPVAKQLLLLVAGGVAWLSMLTKQNAGLFIFPLYLFLLIAVDMPHKKNIGRNLAIFLAGFLGGLAIFGCWLSFYSNPSVFSHYTLEIPAGLLGERFLEKGPRPFFDIVFFGWGPLRWKVILGAFNIIIIAVIFLGVSHFKNNGDLWRRRNLSCGLGLYLFGLQNLFVYSTGNQRENGIVFMGLIYAIGIGLLFFLWKMTSETIKNKLTRSSVITVLIFGICTSVAASHMMFVHGVNISLKRSVHDLFTQSKFPEYFTHEKLRCLQWGEPTLLGGVNIKKQDFIQLYNYLEGSQERFFIFPDFTILYGLLRVPSPQPVLWFHRGVTYPIQYDPGLDEWIVRDLKKNNVTLIVFEKKSLFGTITRLNHFPILKSYILGHFKKRRQIGFFVIFEKIS